MKLLRYGPPGREKPGLLDADGIIRDLSGHVADITGEVLAPDGLDRLAAIAPGALPRLEGSPRLGPPVAAVGKIVGIGLNYRDHAAEAGMPLPKEPVVFMKATTSLCGPNDDILMPPGAMKVDWEVELAVVIGSPARRVTAERALSHVAGYAVMNDVSEREHQLERGGQWDKGKSHDSFGPLGPWLVTADEIPDPQALDLWLKLNGDYRQNGSTADMIFPVAELVSYVSRFMTLLPGDVITTGTPAGVGLGRRPKPEYLKPGDLLELSVAGLGVQRQTVRRADH